MLAASPYSQSRALKLWFFIQLGIRLILIKMFIFGMQANGLNLKFKLLTLIEIDIQFNQIFLSIFSSFLSHSSYLCTSFHLIKPRLLLLLSGAFQQKQQQQQQTKRNKMIKRSLKLNDKIMQLSINHKKCNVLYFVMLDIFFILFLFLNFASILWQPRL